MKKNNILRKLAIFSLAITVALPSNMFVINAETITDAPPKIGASGNVESCDISNPNNLYVTGTPTDNFVVDAQLENSDNIKESQPAYVFGKEAKEVIGDYSAEGVTARSGSKCAKISEKTTFALPGMQDNTYYVLSYYIYTKNTVPNNGAWSTRFTYRDKVTTYAFDFFYSDTDYSDIALNKWSKVSFVIYSGHREKMIKMIFANSGRFTAGNTFYVDDFSLVALPDNVQQAAKAFDEYGSIVYYDSELENKTGNVFASGGEYTKLCSPVKAGIKYSDLYNRLAELSLHTISDKTPLVGTTQNLTGYDVLNPSNLYTNNVSSDNRVVDAYLEHSSGVTDNYYLYGSEAKDVVGDYTSEGVKAHSGNNCAKISGKTTFTLPSMEKNKYYVLSYYMFTNNNVPQNDAWAVRFTYRNQVSTGNSFFYNNALYDEISIGEWTKVSFVIFSGEFSTYIKLILANSSNFSSFDTYYVDDFSLIELPENIQASAKAFDEYGDDLSDDDGTLRDYVGTIFADRIYAYLSSPVKKNVCYYDMYLELTNNIRPYGYMSYNDPNICTEQNNVISDAHCENDSYWSSDAEEYGNTATISSDTSYEGATSLKITGNGKDYIKFFNVTTNTFYYLSLYGMTPQESELNDINFGIVNEVGLHLNNIRSESDEQYVMEATTFPIITINAQDGLWHNRTYRFYSGSATRLGFFATGTNGIMYLDDICIFKVSDAVSSEKPVLNQAKIIETQTNKFSCDPSDNSIANGDFSFGSTGWSEERAYGKFVEQTIIDGNSILHYTGRDDRFYYMPSFPVERNTQYTFSFWARGMKTGEAIFGLSSGSRPHGFLSNPISVKDCVGGWKLYSFSFNSRDDESICFALYDAGGEVYFDQFKLFKSEKGFYADDDSPVEGGAVIQPITDSEPKIGKTGNIDGYDVSNPDNLFVTGTPKNNFVVDAQLENSGNIMESQTAYLFGKEAKEVIRDYSSEGVTARSGSKCAKISEKTMFALPDMQDNTYYVLSFYVYTKLFIPTNGAWSTRFTYRDKVTTNAYDFFYSDTDYSDIVLNKWSKVSFVIYSGHCTQMIKMIFANSGKFNSLYTYYVDDFSLVKLPDNVQSSAKAFDEYSNINGYDSALVKNVGATFCDNTYSALLSPVKKGVSYTSMYNKLLSYYSGIVLNGDVNGDAEVNALDIVRLKKYLAAFSSIKVVVANINLDDDAAKITAGDLAALRKLLLSV